MNDQDKINRAKYADDLKRNPLLQEALTAMKAACFEEFRSTKKRWRFERKLKETWETMKAMERFERYIDRCVAEGKVVEEKKQRQKRHVDY